MNMIRVSQIKPNMPVLCSKNEKFAEVDQMEGDKTIKLKKDKYGQHHFVPLSWVLSTDNQQVKLDRPSEQAINDGAIIDWPLLI